jgi:hypothetical protein
VHNGGVAALYSVRVELKDPYDGAHEEFHRRLGGQKVGRSVVVGGVTRQLPDGLYLFEGDGLTKADVAQVFVAAAEDLCAKVQIVVTEAVDEKIYCQGLDPATPDKPSLAAQIGQALGWRPDLPDGSKKDS